MAAGSEDVRQSLWILLSTATGERVMVPEYGCALSPMVFENLSTTLLTRLHDVVEHAILNWEPRITVDRVVAEADPDVAGLVRIDISYTIRATNARSNLVFPFYLREATIAPSVP